MLFLCPMFRSLIRMPKTLLWVANLFFLLLLLFTCYRVIIFLAFRPSDLTWSQASAAFILGLRYDLRWIAIVLFPVVLLSVRPGLSHFFQMETKDIGLGIWRYSLLGYSFFSQRDLGVFPTLS